MAGDPVLLALRHADPDRYLAALYLPQRLRAAAIALYAFNAEISAIGHRVREPMAGEVRLQWWRDAIKADDERNEHPTAAALTGAIRRFGFSRQSLLTLLEARVFDLYHDPMPDRATLEGYCGETASSLLLILALAAGGEAGTALADACGHAGVAQSLAGLAMRSGSLRAAGKCYLPADLLAATGLTPETWLREPWDERHARAVSAFVALAREHRERAVAAIGALEPALRPVFLPLAPVPAYLAATLDAGPRLLQRVPDISPLRRQWLFARAAWGWFPAS